MRGDLEGQLSAMETRVSFLGPDPASWTQALDDAASILKRGEIVAFPTETVYGLGANALDASAVAKIYAAKGRPSTNPVIVHVSTVEQAKKLSSSWPAVADVLAAAFWPGPLTLIVPKAPSVPNVVTGGGPTIAIRIPKHPVARALLEAVQLPIAAPSANVSNSLSPTTAQHVRKGLDGKIELILDGGAVPGGLESTVVDCTQTPVRICRPGLITMNMLSAVTAVTMQQEAASSEQPLVSPGMLARHYAPRVPLTIMSKEEIHLEDPKTGFLLLGDEIPAQKMYTVERLPDDAAGYSAGLYAALHRLEEQDIDRILVQNPPLGDEWLAVHDRLKRAATL